MYCSEVGVLLESPQPRPTNAGLVVGTCGLLVLFALI